MSSCLILQTHNDLFIGADTACSSPYNGKYYRVNNQYRKLYIIGNCIAFVAGEKSTTDKLVDFLILNISDHDAITEYLTNNAPARINSEIYNVELLICTIINGNSVVYQFSEYNEFEKIERRIEKGATQVLTAGFKNKASLDIATSLINNGCGVESVIAETFNRIACNEIGGHLIAYRLSDKKCFIDNIMAEEGVEYLDCALSEHLVVAEALIGQKIFGNEMELMATNSTDKMVSNFTFNGKGATINNGIFDLYSTVGRISLNPSLGIIGGSRNSLTNSTDNRVLSQSGTEYSRVSDIPASVFTLNGNTSAMPRANFWLDMYGDAYFKGNVYADNGYFRGIVTATDFYFNDGSSVKTLLTKQQTVIPANLLDLSGVYNSINNLSNSIASQGYATQAWVNSKLSSISVTAKWG